VTVKSRPATDTEPVRDVVVVRCVTTKLVVPLPVPAVTPEIEIHDELLSAVQAHPALVVTVTVKLPPAAGIACEVGEIVNEQLPAAWLTVNVWPPTEIVPDRASVVPLTAAAKLIVLPPVPLAFPVIVSHEAPPLTVAVHEQLLDVVRFVDPDPPDAGTFALAEARVYEQPAAACVTLNVCPAIVSEPDRGVVLGFAVTL
jgi:hypothetical protein